MTKKIFIIGVVLIMCLGLFAGCAVKASKVFDSEDDLRKAAPHLCYFDFDLQETRLSQAKAFSDDFVKFGCEASTDEDYHYTFYEIVYYFNSVDFNEVSLSIECSNIDIEKKIPTYKSSTKIGEIQCYIDFDIPASGTYFNIRIVFAIENSTYVIAFNGNNPGLSEHEVLTYFLDIAQPAIENRNDF